MVLQPRHDLPYYIPDILLDFRVMLTGIWKCLKLPEPNRVQLDIADFLQGPGDRKMIEAFRGVAKTWISCAYACSRLLCDPNSNILIIAASEPFAAQSSEFCWEIIQNVPFFDPIRPVGSKTIQRKEHWFVRHADTSRDPSIKALGITSRNLTGSRATDIIPDDIETPNNTQTAEARMRLRHLSKEFEMILKPGGRITYLGTPHNEDSLYLEKAKEGYDVRIWPAQYGWTESNYNGKVSPMLVADRAADPKLAEGGVYGLGKPTNPERFGEEELNKRSMGVGCDPMGKSEWNLQMMLDTLIGLSDVHPLKLRDLIIMDCDRDMAPERMVWTNDPRNVYADLHNVGLPGDHFYRPLTIESAKLIPYQARIMVVDPAGRGDDEIGYAVGGLLNGYIFLLSWGGLRGGPSDENLAKLCEIGKAFGAQQCCVEPNYGDGMMLQLMIPVRNQICPTMGLEDLEWSTGQKELRILGNLEPVVQNHRLIISPEVIRRDEASLDGYGLSTRMNYSGIHQFTRLTRDRQSLSHDDRIEALGMLVAKCKDFMGQDSAANQANREKEDFDRVMTSFHHGDPGWKGNLDHTSDRGKPCMFKHRRNND